MSSDLVEAIRERLDLLAEGFDNLDGGSSQYYAQPHPHTENVYVDRAAAEDNAGGSDRKQEAAAAASPEGRRGATAKAVAARKRRAPAVIRAVQLHTCIASIPRSRSSCLACAGSLSRPHLLYVHSLAGVRQVTSVPRASRSAAADAPANGRNADQ